MDSINSALSYQTHQQFGLACSHMMEGGMGDHGVMDGAASSVSSASTIASCAVSTGGFAQAQERHHGEVISQGNSMRRAREVCIPQQRQRAPRVPHRNQKRECGSDGFDPSTDRITPPLRPHLTRHSGEGLSTDSTRTRRLTFFHTMECRTRCRPPTSMPSHEAQFARPSAPP